jgi:hypothetical protein
MQEWKALGKKGLERSGSQEVVSSILTSSTNKINDLANQLDFSSANGVHTGAIWP